MTVKTSYIHLKTKGQAEVVDLTARVQKAVGDAAVKDGLVTVSVVGSTGAMTTCEFEPGLVADIKTIFDRLIPPGHYEHDAAWGDGNGHSHLRSSLVGPSVTIPLAGGTLILGTWQQIIFIDFDNRPRERKIVVQIIGE